ncbi:unnamed protein product [Trichogramma brassicae]|uniref:Integrase catalytic domain-containing protein n=1 Tax=Trichogramma brassicae TaxID=86971 RepID=A0A6H5IV86_9HYME|nr:unnamed protein product [Trichogramma brassicae]
MTDHRPLSFALEQKSDKFSPRQSRQLDFISRFDTKIVYTPGDENPVADALSRIDAITMPTTLNSAQISAEQQKDEQLTHLRGKAKLKLHDVVIDGLSLVCVEQRNGLKPYLPESLRRQAFDTAHTLSHPSGRATVKRVALLYFWPSMSKDIVRWAKQCVPCQQSKVHRHNRAELGKFRHTGRPIRSCAHRHRQDASSPRISKLPHDDRPLHTLATGHPDRRHVCTNRSQSFFPRMISFFGTPLTITTDQGAQFEGKLLAQLCKLVGAKHVHTSPYHPQANSMVERMHRTLKAALKCSPETPWTLALPGVLLGLRTTFKEDLQASPAEMVFGTSLRIPGECVARQEPDKRRRQSSFSALRRLFQAIRPVPASRHVQHRPFVFKDLATSDYVFRRLDTILKPLEQPQLEKSATLTPLNNAQELGAALLILLGGSTRSQRTRLAARRLGPRRIYTEEISSALEKRAGRIILNETWRAAQSATARKAHVYTYTCALHGEIVINHEEWTVAASYRADHHQQQHQRRGEAAAAA